MGPGFPDYVEKQREWHVGFESCCDAYVYDLVPGRSSLDLVHRFVDTFIQARRITGPQDTIIHQRQILEHLTQEPVTKRVRQIRPGAKVTSIYDEMHGPNARFMMGTNGSLDLTEVAEGDEHSPYLWWNEINAAEAEVLCVDYRDQSLFPVIESPLVLFENSGLLTLLEDKAEKFEYLLEAPLLSDEDDDNESYAGSLTQQKLGLSKGKGVEGAEQSTYSVPPIWRVCVYRGHSEYG